MESIFKNPKQNETKMGMFKKIVSKSQFGEIMEKNYNEYSNNE